MKKIGKKEPLLSMFSIIGLCIAWNEKLIVFAPYMLGRT